MDNVVVGRLCQDPILRQPRRGSRPVARFTVAVNVWRRSGDTFVERAPVFHRVVCFGPMAENVTNSLRKGMEVVAVGEWVDDSYSDELGQRRVQIAMEARAVGPGLRWATASVRRTERKPETQEPPTETTPATDAADPPTPQPAQHQPAERQLTGPQLAGRVMAGLAGLPGHSPPTTLTVPSHRAEPTAPGAPTEPATRAKPPTSAPTRASAEPAAPPPLEAATEPAASTRAGALVHAGVSSALVASGGPATPAAVSVEPGALATVSGDPGTPAAAEPATPAGGVDFPAPAKPSAALLAAEPGGGTTPAARRRTGTQRVREPKLFSIPKRGG
jgi:single-strand DNA-binding protein